MIAAAMAVFGVTVMAAERDESTASGSGTSVTLKLRYSPSGEITESRLQIRLPSGVPVFRAVSAVTAGRVLPDEAIPNGTVAGRLRGSVMTNLGTLLTCSEEFHWDSELVERSTDVNAEDYPALLREVVPGKHDTIFQTSIATASVYLVFDDNADGPGQQVQTLIGDPRQPSAVPGIMNCAPLEAENLILARSESGTQILAPVGDNEPRSWSVALRGRNGAATRFAASAPPSRSPLEQFRSGGAPEELIAFSAVKTSGRLGDIPPSLGLASLIIGSGFALGTIALIRGG